MCVIKLMVNLVLKVPPLTKEEQEAKEALCSSIAALSVEVGPKKSEFLFILRGIVLLTILYGCTKYTAFI